MILSAVSVMTFISAADAASDVRIAAAAAAVDAIPETVTLADRGEGVHLSDIEWLSWKMDGASSEDESPSKQTGDAAVYTAITAAVAAITLAAVAKRRSFI